MNKLTKSFTEMYTNELIQFLLDNDNRSNALPMAYKIGLVFDTIPPHSGSDSKTNRKKAI